MLVMLRYASCVALGKSACVWGGCAISSKVVVGDEREVALAVLVLRRRCISRTLRYVNMCRRMAGHIQGMQFTAREHERGCELKNYRNQ